MLNSLILAALIGTAASTVDAAIPCGPRSEVLGALASVYQERPAAVGLSNTGRLLEIMVREDGRSWTVISTSPDGVSCVLDAGEEWLVQKVASNDPDA